MLERELSFIVELRPLLLPDTSTNGSVIDEEIWLENWLHILAIFQRQWNGFLDCLVENIGVRFSQQIDEMTARWLLLIVEGIQSYSFYYLVNDVSEKRLNIKRVYLAFSF